MTERVGEQEIADAKSVDLARLMGLKFTRRGNALWARCPFHKEKTPSFKVEDGRYKCFGCGVSGDAITWVREQEHLDFAQAVKRLSGSSAPARFAGVRTKPHIYRDDDGLDKRKRASNAWDRALPLAGSPANAYLRARGIDRPPSPELRFLPSELHRESGLTLPCMVGRLSNDHGFLGIQRTFLDPKLPKKADVSPTRKTLGRMYDGAVRLRMPTEGVLGLAEGIETALSAWQIYAVPVWAVLSVNRLPDIDIPRGVGVIAIFGDQGDVGEAGALKAADSYEARGFKVEVYFARSDHDADGKMDFNDILRCRG